MTLRTPSVGDLQILVASYGDIDRDPGFATKYGLLLDELRSRVRVTSVLDTTPRGARRVSLGLRTFRRNRADWKERFYKAPASFSMQTATVRRAIGAESAGQDALLQIGALFDGTATGLPVSVYTDYTAVMSARRPDAGRSPFSAAERAKRMALERGLYQRSSAICTRSAEVAASIRDDYGVPEDRLAVVGGGVNLAPLPPDRETRASSGEPTLLFIGKDFYRKGGDRVLAAFALARGRLGRGRLIMLTDPNHVAGVSVEGVSFVAPTWDRAAISNLYTRADALVSASRLETWGDVVLEAMSHGIPVIGVRDQPMAEIIEDGISGLLADPADAESLADQMTLLLGSESLRRRLGAAAQTTVRMKYTWGAVAERILTETAKRLDALSYGIIPPHPFPLSASHSDERIETLANRARAMTKSGPRAPRSKARYPMRVLQLIDRLRDQGGAEQLQRTLAACARGSDVEVLIATLHENDVALQSAVEAFGARVLALPALRSFDPLRFLRLVRLVRREEVDVIHTHLIRSTILGSLAGRLTATPVVATLHNTRQNRADRALLSRAETWVLEHLVTSVVAVGRETAAANRGRIKSRAIEVIPNAVALRPAPDAAARRRMRAALGVAEDTRLLVAVGRLHEQKGFHDLLEAFAELRFQVPNTVLAIAGEGREREKLAARIAERGLEREVLLLGHRDDVPDLLAAGDVYVSSSLWEGLPLAILEAMVAGLPVVATAVGDVPQIVDESSGATVPPGDPTALAHAIASLLDDPTRARKLGECGRQRVLQEYGLDSWFDRHRALYARLSDRTASSNSAAQDAT